MQPAERALDQPPVKLSCRNVWKVYGDQPDRFFKSSQGKVTDSQDLADRIRAENQILACCDVSFDVHKGEIFVIMGLSGSGKSTIVRCLSRLVEPTVGSILLDGTDLLTVSKADLIDIRRHEMGMVFQSFGLMPHMTVIDNVAFPLRLQGVSKSEQRQRAERVIDLVGLQGREDSFPRQLSGGQQQRVGLARSLAVEPALWFLDEPFSALDPLIRRQMQDEFLRLQEVLQKSIVFITHDFLEALRIADRIAIMREGRIVQVGTPEDLVMKPADSYVAEFTRDVPRVRVLQAKHVAAKSGGPVVDLPRVASEITVEALFPHLVQSPSGVAVADAEGAILGVATPSSVIEKLILEDPLLDESAAC